MAQNRPNNTQTGAPRSPLASHAMISEHSSKKGAQLHPVQTLTRYAPPLRSSSYTDHNLSYEYLIETCKYELES
jgi:hypothetical protein